MTDIITQTSSWPAAAVIIVAMICTTYFLCQFLK